MNYYNNDKPYTYEEIEEIEKKLYKKHFLSLNGVCKIDVSNICSRDIEVLEDRDYNLPQNIFIIKNYKKMTLVGRKLRSVLSIEKKINAINCSMINAPMLLGILKKRSKINRTIKIEYYPFTNLERNTIFEELKLNRNYDIYYPYKYRDYKYHKEKASPDTGWSFTPEKKEYLSYGEVHLRNYTTNYFINDDLANKNIYDPACSTGEFLNDFKKNHLKCNTIGHDLSQEMINYAKEFVDESCCCNAVDSPLKEKTIDLMFLRFLNSEVVSTSNAYKIMKKLLPKMKKGSQMVCFGHTAVLITKTWFQRNGLKILSCNGYDEARNAIFQYYIIEVK